MKGEMKRDKDERKRFLFFFLNNVSRPSNPPDDSAKNVSKKIPFGRIVPSFFFESSESYRVFNYLHYSNSIFRAATPQQRALSRLRVATSSLLQEVSLDTGTCPLTTSRL